MLLLAGTPTTANVVAGGDANNGKNSTNLTVRRTFFAADEVSSNNGRTAKNTESEAKIT